MAMKAYAAYAGDHTFGAECVKVFYCDATEAAQINKRAGLPRNYHGACRTGWYSVRMGSPWQGPFGSSRKAYQAARAQFDETAKRS